MDQFTTWCYFTKFVCRYDQLDKAKKRHQRCVDVLREQYHVHFSSEQAYQCGHAEPIFSLLLVEITGPATELTSEEKDEYSVFCFVTIVDVPDKIGLTGEDEFVLVGRRLEIDFETGFYARFPSRTRGIVVSTTGHELDGCDYN